jgi:hypothetical protein
MPIRYTAHQGPIEQVKNDLALALRRSVFRTFMRVCAPAPDSRVADFGVSGQSDHPAHYFFETWYPYRHNLTAIGREAEDAGWYPDRFPGLTFLEADLRSIPLPDDYFDAGICNAVVEHAGGMRSAACAAASYLRRQTSGSPSSSTHCCRSSTGFQTLPSDRSCALSASTSLRRSTI